MCRQRGVTLTGMVMACVVIALLALLLFRVVPVFVEYTTIQKAFRGIAQDSALKGARRPDLMRAWAARATVDNISALRGDEITIEREGDSWVLRSEYSARVPLFANVSLLFDFHPDSRQ